MPNFFVAILFAVLNALRGQNTIPRWACALGMTMVAAPFAGFVIDEPVSSWGFIQFQLKIITLFGLLWFGLVWGWSLAALGGAMDWDQKFPPAGWVIRKLGLQDPYIAGAVGMGVRWLAFLPAIIFMHGLGSGLILGAFLAVITGFLYYAIGQKVKGRSLEPYGQRICEGATAFLLALVLLA